MPAAHPTSISSASVGGAEVLAALSDGERPSLIARVYCVLEKDRFTVVTEDIGEVTGSAQTDGFILDVEVPTSALATASRNVPIPAQAAEIIRYVVAERKDRDYASTVDGNLFLDGVPVVGKPISGSIDLRSFASCDFARGQECFENRFEEQPEATP